MFHNRILPRTYNTRLRRCFTEFDAAAAVMCIFGLPQALLSQCCMHSDKREDKSCDCLFGQAYSSHTLAMQPLIGCTAFFDFSIWTTKGVYDWRVFGSSLLWISYPLWSITATELTDGLYLLLSDLPQPSSNNNLGPEQSLHTQTAEKRRKCDTSKRERVSIRKSRPKMPML
ncbi:hypothetical protein LI328DRAFT_164478 [Trichoderma asperelloides]|nr:hypothetical protein LI328DRAFT_164478 [Trichoderma asperelloides]